MVEWKKRTLQVKCPETGEVVKIEYSYNPVVLDVDEELAGEVLAELDAIFRLEALQRCKK